MIVYNLKHARAWSSTTTAIDTSIEPSIGICFVAYILQDSDHQRRVLYATTELEPKYRKRPRTQKTNSAPFLTRSLHLNPRSRPSNQGLHEEVWYRHSTNPNIMEPTADPPASENLEAEVPPSEPEAPANGHGNGPNPVIIRLRRTANPVIQKKRKKPMTVSKLMGKRYTGTKSHRKPVPLGQRRRTSITVSFPHSYLPRKLWYTGFARNQARSKVNSTFFFSIPFHEVSQRNSSGSQSWSSLSSNGAGVFAGSYRDFPHWLVQHGVSSWNCAES